jgi:hypothetical protein
MHINHSRYHYQAIISGHWLKATTEQSNSASKRLRDSNGHDDSRREAVIPRYAVTWALSSLRSRDVYKNKNTPRFHPGPTEHGDQVGRDTVNYEHLNQGNIKMAQA